jgi:hypothetical protein
MHDEVRRMLRLEVIEPSSSEWSHPLVAVPKPNGKTKVCMKLKTKKNKPMTRQSLREVSQFVD